MNAVHELAEGDAPRLRRAPNMSRYFFVVGLLVYVGVVWYFGWRQVRDALLGADVRWVAVAATIYAASTWTRIFKWRYALGSEHQPVGLYFLSKATGLWSPGRMGEFLPLLWRRHRKARIGGWILLDRVVEVIVTLALGVLGLGMLRLLDPLAFLGVLAAVAAASAFAVYVITRRDLLQRWSDRFAHRPRLGAALGVLAQTSGEIRGFRASLPVVSALTLTSKAADFYAVALIFRGLGYNIGFMLTAAAKCALAIVSFLPVTPVATGVPHAVQGWIMNEVAAVPPEVIVASVGIEAALLLVVFWTSVGIAARSIKAAAL